MEINQTEEAKVAEPKTNGNGALIGSIIIVIILVIGGIYLWRKTIKERPAPQNPEDLANLDQGL